MGTSTPFPPEKVRALYPDHAAWFAKYRVATERLVETGVFLPDDAEDGDRPGLDARAPRLIEPRMLDIQPFRVAVPDAVLADLHDRLDRVRLPNWIEDIGWEQGIEQATFEQLLDHWRDGFDWRAQEERLNRVEHGITEVDGQPIHFVHARSPRPDALPLVLVHGWPGSFHEFLDAIPLLTDPPDGGDAFHVVAPSVPGFAWSGADERARLERAPHRRRVRPS